MKIIRNVRQTHFGYAELIVERNWLFFKRTETYRKFKDGTILRYHGDQKYSGLSFMGLIDIERFFKTPEVF